MNAAHVSSWDFLQPTAHALLAARATSFQFTVGGQGKVISIRRGSRRSQSNAGGLCNTGSVERRVIHSFLSCVVWDFIFPLSVFTVCLAPFYHLKGNAKRHLGLTVPSLSSGGGLLCPSNYQWWTRGRKRKQRWKMNIQLTSSFPWWHLLLCHATAFQNLTHIYMPLRGRACVCCPVKSQARIYMLCWIGAIYPSFSLTLRATLRFCWSNKTEHTHTQKEETRERKCIY